MRTPALARGFSFFYQEGHRVPACNDGVSTHGASGAVSSVEGAPGLPGKNE